MLKIVAGPTVKFGRSRKATEIRVMDAMVKHCRRQLFKQGDKMLPKPGSEEYEKMIDFMRADLDSGMRYSKIITNVRKKFEEEGRDFDEEFKNREVS